MPFKPIVPRNPDLFAGAIVGMTLAMRNYGFDLKKAMQTYPKSQSATRRTGTLGRRWTMAGPTIKGGDLVVHVGNRTDYAPFVEGFKDKDPRQKKLFAGYGWPRLDETAERLLTKHKPKIQDSLKGT